MDARVSPAHTFQLLLHTPLPYGLVPINNSARRIYRWLHGVPHICGMPWPHSCSSVPHTMQTAPLDWCNQAPSTKHCGRFFPNSSAYFTYWPLLPAFRCHNARSSPYLILYSGVKIIIATFHQMNGQVIFSFYKSNTQTVPWIKYGNVSCFQGLLNAECIFWVTFFRSLSFWNISIAWNFLLYFISFPTKTFVFQKHLPSFFGFGLQRYGSLDVHFQFQYLYC